jgi:transcriptional regulator with XRE-family HTH domain
MYDISIVAANIRKARMYRGYSQDYLAYQLKISQNAYSKLECGHTKIDLERIIAIANLLEVDLIKLLKKDEMSEDVALVNSIEMVPAILDVVCHATGMGFAAIARVTDDRWIACSVRDEIKFGLTPGDELRIETTICNEIRQSGQAVIIDHVDSDDTYRCHHTPAMYGFQSYISIPILRQNGEFFGTLCAIDPKPHKLTDAATVKMFKLFADLISFHLNAASYPRVSPKAVSRGKKIAIAIITS